MDILFLLTLFFIKHWLIDFVWQTPAEIANKGTYLKWAGLVHSVKHGIGTFVILWITDISFEMLYFLSLADIIIHYHIDWAKMNLSKDLTAADHKFWVWLGFDQLLHHLTYVVFIDIMLI